MADIKKICRYCGHAVPNEKEIRAKAIDECIKIIEETVWKDTNMLVESIRELKGVRNEG